MILWMKMAFKKLIVNRYKTVVKVMFLGFLFSLITTISMFKTGSENQMNSIHRNYSGDVTFSAKEDCNLSKTLEYIKTEYGASLDEIIPGITMSLEVSSSSSFVHANCISSTPVLFKKIESSIGWMSYSQQPMAVGFTSLESSLAKSLNVTAGDVVTLKYSGNEEYGMINTIDLIVDGIFIGNNLIYDSSILMSIEDMTTLTMDNIQLNELRLYFSKNFSLIKMREIALNINKQFYKVLKTSSATLDPTGGIMGIYKYYNMLLSFVLGLIIMIFIIILNFSNQNLFFMEFRSRRAELSTLLTYGIKKFNLKLMLFFESLYLFIFAALFSAVLTFVSTRLLGLFYIDSINLSGLLTVMGGPNLTFHPDFRDLMILVILLFCTTIISAARGARAYINLEIREIISTTK